MKTNNLKKNKTHCYIIKTVLNKELLSSLLPDILREGLIAN